MSASLIHTTHRHTLTNKKYPDLVADVFIPST